MVLGARVVFGRVGDLGEPGLGLRSTASARRLDRRSKRSLEATWRGILDLDMVLFPSRKLAQKLKSNENP